MQVNKPTKIRYTRTTNFGEGSEGDVTERVIIPTRVPSRFVKALDVTKFTEEAREDLSKLLQEYTEYYTKQMQTIFSFEDWLEHTRGEGARVDPLIWRTFVSSEILEE